MTEQELKDKLVDFRRWLEAEGHPQGTIESPHARRVSVRVVPGWQAATLRRTVTGRVVL